MYKLKTLLKYFLLLASTLNLFLFITAPHAHSQVINGNVYSRNVNTNPNNISTLDNVIEVSTDDSFSLALKSDGTV